MSTLGRLFCGKKTTTMDFGDGEKLVTNAKKGTHLEHTVEKRENAASRAAGKIRGGLKNFFSKSLPSAGKWIGKGLISCVKPKDFDEADADLVVTLGTFGTPKADNGSERIKARANAASDFDPVKPTTEDLVAQLQSIGFASGL